MSNPEDAGLVAAWEALHDETIPASNRYIRAIKAHREASGSGLIEAKDAVDCLRSGRIWPPVTAREPQDDGLPLVQWRDKDDVLHTITTDGALEVLRYFYEQWPGGIEEHRAELRAALQQHQPGEVPETKGETK